jgi:hypothetical protein
MRVVDVRAVVAASALLTGCFFVDPIIERPHVQIEVVQPSVIYRGGTVTLAANFVGTGTGLGTYDWKLVSCAGFGTSAQQCDDTAFFTASASRENMVSFSVPVMTRSGAGKTQAIQVQLEARSDRGALALRDDNSDFAVADAPPTLQVNSRAHSFSVGAPIDLFATYGDPDDPAAEVQIDWAATAPTAAGTYTLDDLAVAQDPADPDHRSAGKRLTPGQPGDWDVKVTARDAAGMANPQHVQFAVAPDQPPCLQQWLPIVAPAGTALPIDVPTVFQVLLVGDDLDAYPPIQGATQFGTTVFAWSILPPRATQRQTLPGATGNVIELDPAAFTPGDLVELRVEIFDRHHTALPCDDSAATCSITASTCLQRQTWRVEVR